jgi:hypothetical protein
MDGALAAGAVRGCERAPERERGGLYPDIRTVVPRHLQLVHSDGRDILRFSNGIANTGDGPWAVRPENDLDLNVTHAIQEIRDSDGQVVFECEASTFAFHPAHNHWHIGDIALFEIREGTPSGPIVGGNSRKVTFCLIDWYALEGNSPTIEREFWDCVAGYQGVSVGWVDQYHQATPGQDLDLTGVPDGMYYLVSTANPEGVFLEEDYTNNMAWVSFRLYTAGNGNRKIAVTGHSPCDSPDDSPGLCGDSAPNR